MKKIIFLIFMAPSLALGARLGSLNSGQEMIISTDTLQSGASFYVSSGTVQGWLSVSDPDNNNTLTIRTTSPDNGLPPSLAAGIMVDALANNGAFGSGQFGFYAATTPYASNNQNAAVFSMQPAYIDYLSLLQPSRANFTMDGDGVLNLSKNAVIAYAPLNATSLSSSAVPLNVSGYISQSADLQDWKDYSGVVLASVTASGAFTGNGSGLTGLIKNQGTLQSGATFYVSSGSVSGQLTVGSIQWPDGTIQVSSPTAGGGGGSSSGVSGAVQFSGGSGAFSSDDANFHWDNSLKELNVAHVLTPSSELVLEQTGDTYGTTRLHIQSRNGSAGALFESAGLPLVDFGFKGTGGSQSNLRFDQGLALENSANTTGEMQILDQATGGGVNVPFVVGQYSVVVGGTWIGRPSSAKFGVNRIAPVAMIDMQTFNSSTIGVIFQGSASQSVDLIQTQDSGTNLKWGVDKNGYPFPPSRTKAQLATDVPSKAGVEAYCSDCSTDGIVVSTGSAAGQWGRISARTTAIQ